MQIRRNGDLCDPFYSQQRPSHKVLQSSPLIRGQLLPKDYSKHPNVLHKISCRYGLNPKEQKLKSSQPKETKLKNRNATIIHFFSRN